MCEIHENIDNRALNRWQKSNISYKNYQDYLKSKRDKYGLTLIDLFYISNFKGGNATINENEEAINKKLSNYSKVIKKIDKEFPGKHLKDLQEDEVDLLISSIDEIFKLASNVDTKIDGFSYSYISALLNSLFPNLIPILDRRILINLEIVTNLNETYSDGQIKNIDQYYSFLIKRFYNLSKCNNCSLREIDREYFIRVLPELV